MRLSKWMMIFLALSAPFALQAGRSKPLQQPHIHVDVAVSDTQLEDIIKHALVGRGWEVLSTEAGIVHARLILRSHVAEIEIPYSDHAIDLQYVRSTNLRYRRHGDGTETIHRNYNSWINNIKQDILVGLSLYR